MKVIQKLFLPVIYSLAMFLLTLWRLQGSENDNILKVILILNVVVILIYISNTIVPKFTLVRGNRRSKLDLISTTITQAVDLKVEPAIRAVLLLLNKSDENLFRKILDAEFYSDNMRHEPEIYCEYSIDRSPPGVALRELGAIVTAETDINTMGAEWGYSDFQIALTKHIRSSISFPVIKTKSINGKIHRKAIGVVFFTSRGNFSLEFNTSEFKERGAALADILSEILT